MQFRLWLENEAGLNSGFPEARPNFDPSDPTVASAEVKRTGLQPQVDSQEIQTKQKSEQDKILAIDSEIEHLDSNLPDGDDADTPKINEFRRIWKKLKEKWDAIKMSENPTGEGEEGLGNKKDDRYTDLMRRYPNMIPTHDQGPNGPGVMGQF